MSATAFDLDTANREARWENVPWAFIPQFPKVSKANGTQVHPNSKHYGSLATCLWDSGATAATTAVEQGSSRIAGVTVDVTVNPKLQANSFLILLAGMDVSGCYQMEDRSLPPL